MATRKTSSLNRYVGKYQHCDEKDRLGREPDHVGLELRPDGTYYRDMGKPRWEGKYSIKGDVLLLNGYWTKRTARGKFKGNILTIYDKGEYKGKATLIKTWPMKERR